MSSSISTDTVDTGVFTYIRRINFLENRGYIYFRKNNKTGKTVEISQKIFDSEIKEACDNYKKKEALKYRTEIIIEPDGDQFHAYCPALKGLHVPGDTEEEALQNAKDAIVAYVCSLLKHDEPIPRGVKKKREKEMRVELITQASLKNAEPDKDPVALVFNKWVEKLTIIDRQLKIEYRQVEKEETQWLLLPIDKVHEVKITML